MLGYLAAVKANVWSHLYNLTTDQCPITFSFHHIIHNSYEYEAFTQHFMLISDSEMTTESDESSQNQQFILIVWI